MKDLEPFLWKSAYKPYWFIVAEYNVHILIDSEYDKWSGIDNSKGDTEPSRAFQIFQILRTSQWGEIWG